MKTASAITNAFLLVVPPEDRHDAVALLEELGTADADALAMRLTMKLRARPSEAIGWGHTLVETLSIVVAMIKGRAVDRTVDPTDDARVEITAELLRRQIHGVYKTRQQAAAAAITQIGGAHAFGIPHYLAGDLDNPDHTASRDTLDAVEHLADTGHGWYFPAVPRVGYLLYSINDR